MAEPTRQALPAQANTAWYPHYTWLDSGLRYGLDAIATTATRQEVVATGLDPTGATDTSAAMLTAFATVQNGGRFIVPPGTYLHTGTPLDPGNKDITIILDGATFIQNDTSAIIQPTGVFDTAIAVSANSATTGTGGGGEVLLQTTLTLASSPSWVRGDVVKVVSDEILPETTSCRPGQFLTVFSVSGTTAVLAGRLRDTYTTNVRVARLPKSRLRISGGEFIASDALLAGTPAANPPIYVKNMVGPIVEHTRVLAAAGPAVTFLSCLDYLADDIGVDYAQNDNVNKFGYGINSDGSTGGVVRGLHAKDVRHGYTCNGGSTGANTAVSLYGRTYGDTVVDSIVIGASQTGFDTHESGENITFANCKSIDCYSGFGLRGKNHQINGGLVKGGARGGGVNVFSLSGKRSYGHHIGGGLKLIDVDGSQLINAVSAAETVPVVWDGIRMTGVPSGKNVWQLSNSVNYFGEVVADSATSTGVTSSTLIALPRWPTVL